MTKKQWNNYSPLFFIVQPDKIFNNIKRDHFSYFSKYPISVYAYLVLLILPEKIKGMRIIKMIRNATKANPHKSDLKNVPDVTNQ